MIGKLVALLGAIALICYQSSQIHKWHERSLALSAKLDAISTKRNEQKRETGERIKVVTRTIHDAEGRAEKVERAPLPGNCRSPQEVLDADI
jgi:hypothetical protein